ncbi:MAG: LAGLIDADG family homing endonuclease [Thermoproteota archaeon]
MGGGSRIGQYERRFHEGEQEREREEIEVSYVVKTFGEYEIREAESGGYELLKGGEVIGTFTEAEIEEDRVVFKLAYGTSLEVSEKGVREILSPAKAELCGLLASDGCVRVGKGGRYEVSLSTVDEEMVEAFKRLCEEVYGITPPLLS